MKSILYTCCICLLLFAVSSCKQDDITPVVNDGVAPGPVGNTSVVNLNGSATITYTVPSDDDLQYVKATYTSKQGVLRETKVSRYNNNLTVLGFGDTSAYQVSLYAVDKGENISAPVVVTVHPKTPLFKLVRDSLAAIPDFGGLNVSFKNFKEDNVAIVVLANDSLGNFVPANTLYTKLKKGDFSVRGFKSEKTKFGIFTRDRWGNLSDTLYVNLTPFFEIRLDRTKMRGLVLPTDAPLGYSGNLAALFDGDVSNTGGYYHTGDAAKMPQWFTYDMGISVKLSRLTYFMRQGYYYSLHNPRNVEIWGTNNPSPDGSFAGWTLLTTHNQVKPSGLPAGQLSQDDITAATAGETITFPLSIPKVRYIRFKTTRNWSDGTYVNFNEIYMFGDPN